METLNHSHGCPQCRQHETQGEQRERYREIDGYMNVDLLAVAASSLRRVANKLDLFAQGRTTRDDVNQSFAQAVTHADLAFEALPSQWWE